MILLFCLRVAAGASSSEIALYVSPQGDDRDNGAIESPVATIQRARDLLRAHRKSGKPITEEATIWLGAGEYQLSDTLRLTAEDSKTRYAAEPNEQVIVSGGSELEADWFAKISRTDPGWERLPVSARGHVWITPLRAHGLADFGQQRQRGFDLRGAAAAELSVNGQPMTLARWPNVGEPLAATGRVVSPTQFKIDSRAKAWSTGSAWLHGFWAQPWADYRLQIATFDAAGSIVSVAKPPPQFGIKAGQPYCAENILEELDAPGEYFIDTTSGILYWWPIDESPTGRIQLSGLESPLVRCDGASHVNFEGIAFEACRGALVEIMGGEGVVLDHCSLRGAGQYAVLLEGRLHGLNHCEVSDAGEEGVIIRGGDRATLRIGGNFVTHSRIARTGRIAWTYRPAILLDGGCGNLVAHNLIQDLPHSAILFSGDLHRIEANEITRVCLITGDAGAIYSGHDWGYRGNSIRNNFIHHLDSTVGQVHGVYLDDCLSGTAVTGNIFYEIHGTAVFCGGGRDTTITGNLIGDCQEGHYNDDRGRERINNRPGDYWNLLERLSASGIRYRENPRATAFPACAAIPPTWPAVQQGLWRNPEGCRFTGNAGWNNHRWIRESNASGTGVFAVYASMDGNNSSVTAPFDEASSLDRTRRPDQIVVDLPGFEPIRFREIGPERDDSTNAPTPARRVRRIEIEHSYAVVTDLHKNGTVGVAKGELDSGESLRMYDRGDAIRIGVIIPKDGIYRIKFRVRSGGSTGRAVFWPTGYSFRLDRSLLLALGDPGTISGLDRAYGGCYWGTMVSKAIRLSAGRHLVDITAEADWAVVDYLDLIPVSETVPHRRIPQSDPTEPPRDFPNPP